MSEGQSKELIGPPEGAQQSQDSGAPQPSGRKKRRNEQPIVPAELVREIVAAAQVVRENHKARFLADPKLKDRAARLFRTLLPPSPAAQGGSQSPASLELSAGFEG